MRNTKLPTIPPGIVLLDEFMRPMNIGQYELRDATGIPQSRISRMITGKRAITADSALRLGKFFDPSMGLPANHWPAAQDHHVDKMTRLLILRSIDVNSRRCCTNCRSQSFS
jgi:addiction module HigA family antidote